MSVRSRFSLVLLICAVCFASGCKTIRQQTAEEGNPPVAAPQPTAVVPAAPVPVVENPYMKIIDQSLYTPFVSESLGPLPPHVTVKVAQWGVLDGYEVIGYAEVQGDTIQDRIKNAERYARAFGGDVLMPKGVTTREQLTNTYRDRLTQGFLIWRKKPSPVSVPPITVIDVGGPRQIPVPPTEDKEKKNKEPLLQDLTEKPRTVTTPAKEEFPIYGKLPRLTYNKLLENGADVKGQNFRGASFALKLFKVPEDIGLDIGADKRMVMLATRSGENKLFLVVTPEKEKYFQDLIKSDKIFEFVYTPLGIYKDKFPVLQFVDEMK
ncbi:MAG TPA: hypothetical protein VF857_00745 [Spirochaetota bacterium]